MTPHLSVEDFCRILKLYKYDVNTCRMLLEKMRNHGGIDYFLNYGPRRVYGELRVVGVGFTGILLLASSTRGIVLTKIMRKDSRRKSMLYECNITRTASSLGVSPRIYACDDEYIIMEYIDGTSLAEYIEKYGELRSIYDLKLALKSILYKTFLLDYNHIDHGELSRPYKHVLISPKGLFIIDFDSASLSRIPRNLTSILGGLFFRRNKFSRRLKDILCVTDKQLREVQTMIRYYKKHVNFDIVVQIIEKLKIF